MKAGGGSDVSTSPLGDRYNVVQELGRGGFGQTYLAEDLHRYKELCVVKEFVPQVEDKAMLDKAKELFEREARTLYLLSHPQIPEFRQLLQVDTESGGRLFLVQSYIEGPTYQQLLKTRQQYGGNFTETEITQLLYQILPVLSYIHGLGIVHRDISPDNLILDQAKGLPVLIDFGSVKEIAASIRAQLEIEGVGPTVTRIGKVGYVPQEQLATGSTNATSDLYGLAATLLVLATGQDPQVLHDTYHGTWTGFETLSPQLGEILAKMLAASPEARFQTADSVLAALNQGPTDGFDTQPPVTSGSLYPAVEVSPADDFAETFVDGEVASDMAGDMASYDAPPVIPMTAAMGGAPVARPIASTYETGSYQTDTYPTGYDTDGVTTAGESNVYRPGGPSKGRFVKPDSRQAIIALLVMLGAFSTFLLYAWLRLPRTPQPQLADGTSPGLIEGAESALEGDFYSEENRRKAEILRRREALGLGNNTFTRLVDQRFYGEYPNLLTSGPNGGRKALSSAPEDEPLRIRWDNLALDLLGTLEGNFSQRSLEGLGSYDESDRTRWQNEVNQVNVSTQALYDLTDAQFRRLFSAQANSEVLGQPLGQLYYALADENARAIASGAAREDVQFAPGTFRQDLNARLDPGDGRVYTLALTAGQLLRLNLNAPAESTLLSLYLPRAENGRSAIFAGSEQTIWSGNINQSGIYEVVVVNQSPNPIDLQLATAVDNVTADPPVAPERPEEEADSSPAGEGENRSEDTSETEDTAEGNNEDNGAGQDSEEEADSSEGLQF